MATISEGVYWCARDMTFPKVLGNHHFILIITSAENLKKLGLEPREAGGIYFSTLATFKNGYLKYDPNNSDDCQSVQEKILENTKWYKPDFDLEYHKVLPPSGSNLDLIQKVVTLAKNYESNKENVPQYSAFAENCACWVNTLFKCAGIGDKQREEYGEFAGIDVSEENLIDGKYFTSEQLTIDQRHKQSLADWSDQDAGYFAEDLGSEQSLAPDWSDQDAGYFAEDLGSEQSLAPDWSDQDAGYFAEDLGSEQSLAPDWSDQDTGYFAEDLGSEQSLAPDWSDQDTGYFAEDLGSEQSLASDWSDQDTGYFAEDLGSEQSLASDWSDTECGEFPT